MYFIKQLLDYIFPPVCGMCGKICINNLCNMCYYDIKHWQKNKIDKHNDKYFSNHLYLFDYEGIIREKIIDYKFNDKAYLYRTFVEILVKNFSVNLFLKNCDLLIPVPIHKKRKLERGYNQSELITKEISKILNIETNNSIIVKQTMNRQQSSLNKIERENNVKNAYIVLDREKVKNKDIILFDDIYTTGSTVNEISRVLKVAGADNVDILTIAKD